MLCTKPRLQLAIECLQRQAHDLKLRCQGHTYSHIHQTCFAEQLVLCLAQLNAATLNGLSAMTNCEVGAFTAMHGNADGACSKCHIQNSANLQPRSDSLNAMSFAVCIMHDITPKSCMTLYIMPSISSLHNLQLQCTVWSLPLQAFFYTITLCSMTSFHSSTARHSQEHMHVCVPVSTS